MTDLSPLSPVAQAVLKAACIHHGLFNEEIVQRRRMVAAALRAAAANWQAELASANQVDFVCGVLRSAEALEEIANELEAR